jgi:hypothetical protein
VTRFHDWPERLAEFIEGSRETPFEYGSHDCCRFAGKVVHAITGEDPMTAFDYRSRLGAERLVRSAGTLDALINRTLGEPVHSSRAGRGDVVVADLEEGSTVGICLGEQCVFATDPVGITFRPRSMIRAAWRIE